MNPHFSSQVVIVRDGDALFASSHNIAEMCEVDHRSVISLIDDHKQTIESNFGVLRFEIAKPTGTSGGRPSRSALLTEDQATFLITLFRNTEPVVRFKAALVAAFRAAKNQLASSKPTLPSNYLEALEALVATEKEKLTLQAENEAMLPKVAYFEAASASKDGVTVGTVCKMLELGYGDKTLFAKMREDGIMFRRDDCNVPMQEYANKGYFTVKQRVIFDAEGLPRTKYTPLVTSKGVDFIRRKYATQQEARA